MVNPLLSERSRRGWVTRRRNHELNRLLTNAGVTEKARSNFLAEFTGLDYLSPKHNHYYDYGYPESVPFASTYKMYLRHGIARGAINMTAEKTWETVPQFLESPADEDETPQEGAVASQLRRIRFFQNLVETDKRSMVGAYAGLIMRIADNRLFREPVERVTNGIAALVEVIPAWQGQLKVSEFETNERDPNYGQPKMFQFNEANISGTHKKARSFEVHPDRVLILSDSGTVHDRSALEPGYNALLDIEKISGAGGEGFWKNAKAAPVLKVDKDAKLKEMADAMNTTVDQFWETISEQVEDFNTGLDKMLMLQAIEVDGHDVNLISPEHFVTTSMQIFAASMSIPMRVLRGNETGERASTEDQRQWAKTNMSRRDNRIIPFLDMFLDRIRGFGMIDEAKEWFVHWDSLMEDSPAEKMSFSKDMAEINSKASSSGIQPPFTHDEIRERVGYDPLEPADMLVELDEDHDEIIEEE